MLCCECWLAVDPAGNRVRAAFAHCFFPIFLVPGTLADQFQLGQHGAARDGTVAVSGTRHRLGAGHCRRDSHGQPPLDSARGYFSGVRGDVVYVCVLWISCRAISTRARTRLAMGRGTAQEPENGGRGGNGARTTATSPRSGAAAFL